MIFNVDTGVVSLLEGTHGSLQQIEINELVVTMPQIVGCGPWRKSQPGTKLKEHCEKIHNQDTFWLVGSGVSTVLFLKGGWFPLYC